MKRARGFTIIELMIVVTIIAVLFVIVAPSMTQMIRNSRVRSFTSDLRSDIALAKSQAQRESSQVVFCPSSDQTTCNAAGTLADGWIVFIDSDRNFTLSAGDRVLRVHGPGEFIAVTDSDTVHPISIRSSIGYSHYQHVLKICSVPIVQGSPGRIMTLYTSGRLEYFDYDCNI